jgi:hypothetical protein
MQMVGSLQKQQQLALQQLLLAQQVEQLKSQPQIGPQQTIKALQAVQQLQQQLGMLMEKIQPPPAQSQPEQSQPQESQQRPAEETTTAKIENESPKPPEIQEQEEEEPASIPEGSSNGKVYEDVLDAFQTEQEPTQNLVEGGATEGMEVEQEESSQPQETGITEMSTTGITNLTTPVEEFAPEIAQATAIPSEVKESNDEQKEGQTEETETPPPFSLNPLKPSPVASLKGKISLYFISNIRRKRGMGTQD